MKKSKIILVGLALGVACAGCNGAPAIDVLGSFFPAWMVCIIVAVALAFVARSLLLKYQLDSEVGHVAIFYPCVVLMFACGLWLLFFR